jgi:uncharacterized protein (DUF433 family)
LVKKLNWQERIVIDPNILIGKPVIKGTRLSVEFILDLLAQSWSENDIIENYPGIAQEDIKACLSYASDALKNEIVYPLKV